MNGGLENMLENCLNGWFRWLKLIELIEKTQAKLFKQTV